MQIIIILFILLIIYFYSQKETFTSNENYDKIKDLLNNKLKNNLIGFYSAEKSEKELINLAYKFNNNISENQYNATIYGLDKVKINDTHHVLKGTPASSILWHFPFPKLFTIFAVVKLNSDSGRVLQFQNSNSFFGHDSNRGIINYNGINYTEGTSIGKLNDWLVFGFRNDTYLPNNHLKAFILNENENITYNGKNNKYNCIINENDRLSINILPGRYGNTTKSSFEFLNLIIFEGILSDTDMLIIYNALNENKNNGKLFENLII
jgi:hypothetical protein